MSHPLLNSPCRGFAAAQLGRSERALLEEITRGCRGDILAMTAVAGSGHPGGSLSSLEIFTVLWSLAHTYPDHPHEPTRDRIVVSHGHTAPGVYSVLGRLGFFDAEQAVLHFRQRGSPFEGHIERRVPGVEWGTGNLGQGLSVGCGMALGGRLNGDGGHVYVVMGDGEQQKGQIAEARRFACKYELVNVTAFVDVNGLQIGGDTAVVMPQDIRAEYLADGWQVLEVDGHDLDALYGATRAAVTDRQRPTVILANTMMGRGIPAIEGRAKYHGQAVEDEVCEAAFRDLGLAISLDGLRRRRPESIAFHGVDPPRVELEIDPGTPRTYTAEQRLDNRSAWGNALADLVDANADDVPMAVFDCDLEGSVKTGTFHEKLPNQFFESGIQEHHTAAAAGAMSATGVLTFFADFGVFGVCETYNQHRLTDINGGNLKVVCTHIGLDVGEDGKTHQCIDYLGLLHSLHGFRTIVPADPNQTDRAARYVATQAGNLFLGMGRSKMKPILATDGSLFFGGDYRFEYGSADVLREGSDCVVIAMGSVVGAAVAAHELLADVGIGARIVNMACPRDVDRAVLQAAAATGLIVTCEDHNPTTGLGSSVANALLDEALSCRLVRLGVSVYGESAPPADLYAAQGLDAPGIAAAVQAALR
ncbi:MAG: transketolase [Nitrospirota bacterium]